MQKTISGDGVMSILVLSSLINANIQTKCRAYIQAFTIYTKSLYFWAQSVNEEVHSSTQKTLEERLVKWSLQQLQAHAASLPWFDAYSMISGKTNHRYITLTLNIAYQNHFCKIV